MPVEAEFNAAFPPGPSPSPKHYVPTDTNRREYYLSDFGAVLASVNPKFDNGPIVQSALDFIKSLSNPVGGTLVVDGVYNCWHPVFDDADNTTIRGVGRMNSALNFWNSNVGLICGLKRFDPPTDMRVDSFGKLDTTACKAAGQRSGLWTTSAVEAGTVNTGAFVGTGFDLGRGDGYQSTKQLTIEWCHEATQYCGYDGFMSNMPLFGMRGNYTVCGPFIVMQQQKVYSLMFTTSDGVNRLARIPFADDTTTKPTGLQHIAFQIDLTAGTVSGFRNRVEVAVSTATLGAGWQPGLSFLPNESYPFIIAGLDQYITAPATAAGQNGDTALHGLRVSDALKYKSGTPGQPQTRVDGAACTDLNSYFVVERDTLGLIDTAATTPHPMLLAGRLPGGAACYAPVCSANHTRLGVWGQPWQVGSSRLENITIGLRSQYGAAVLGMATMDFVGEDVILYGASHGFCSLNYPCNSYPMTWTRCQFIGQWANYYGMGNYVTFRDCVLKSAGCYGFLFAGSTVNIDGGFWSQLNTTSTRAGIRLLRGTGASQFVMKDATIDHEFPLKGATGFVWADAGMTQAGVTLERVSIFQLSDQVPLVTLDGNSNTVALCSIKDCFIPKPISEIVRVQNRYADGRNTHWFGKISGLLGGGSNGAPVVKYLNGSEKCSLIQVDDYPSSFVPPTTATT